MKSLPCYTYSHISTIGILPHPHCIPSKKKTSFRVTAKPGSGDDPLLQAAIYAATLRFQEAHQPEPLFHDPYVASLVPENTSIAVRPHAHPYCLATRFIDDKLLQILRNTDDVKQVVLLTDGADTRPYRLNWPSSTLIFDISADRIYNEMTQKLKGIGAHIISNCLLIHVSLESSNIQEVLRNRGFNGNRPSIWVLQGLPLITLENIENVLSIVGSLAMKGCFLVGEIPFCLADTEVELKSSREEWMHTLFMSHGFQVRMIQNEDVAESLGRELSREASNCVLFVAEHLRFSDDQMDTWRREFQRTEEEGDEEGFEDL